MLSGTACTSVVRAMSLKVKSIAPQPIQSEYQHSLPDSTAQDDIHSSHIILAVGFVGVGIVGKNSVYIGVNLLVFLTGRNAIENVNIISTGSSFIAFKSTTGYRKVNVSVCGAIAPP